MLSMIMVGFSSNIWMALVGRALGGFLVSYTIFCLPEFR
jgi:hypothetical protein